MLYTPTLRGPHAIVRAVISLLNIPGNSTRTGTHQTVEWSPSGYDRFGGEGGPAAYTWDYDSRLPEGHPKPKVTGAMRGGRGAGHGESPSGKDRTAGWGTPRQGSHPGELEFSPGIYRSGVGVPALVVIIPGYDVVT